jgi:hypothetical protein
MFNTKSDYQNLLSTLPSKEPPAPLSLFLGEGLGVRAGLEGIKTGFGMTMKVRQKILRSLPRLLAIFHRQFAIAIGI